MNIPVAGSGSGGLGKDITLLATGWTKSAPYSQTVTDEDVSASSSIFCSLKKTETDVAGIELEYQKITISVTEGQLVFSTSTPITNDITLSIIINDI